VHRSLHHVRDDLAHFVWDNAIEPALEVDDGEVVELEVRDASGGQLDRGSSTADVAGLDFTRVNPVTGPVFVRGARPGDALAVEILELRPRDWGWTAIIPGFGLLADEFARGRRRPAHPRGGRCAQLGRRVLRARGDLRRGGTAMSTQTRNPEEAGVLRRELRFWEAIALSIAIMAPTAAMALNGTVPAQLVGQAVPLAFIFATVGVIFVSYAFIRLSASFSHAGSVYAFSGVTLGPRAGFFSGWALFGTYLAFTAASTAEAGLFGVAFFQGSGIWDGAEWLVIALVAGVLIALIAYGDIRVATRSLLGLEGISVISSWSWSSSSSSSWSRARRPTIKA
jgi:hypothetical protein